MASLSLVEADFGDRLPLLVGLYPGDDMAPVQCTSFLGADAGEQAHDRVGVHAGRLGGLRTLRPCATTPRQ